MVENPVQSVQNIECYRDDGRKSLAELYRSYVRLSEDYGWDMEGLYSQTLEVSGGESVPIPILSFRTPLRGPALWVLGGIHGEEPASPNAIAENVELFADLGKRGVPMVLIPLCSPKAYALNRRFPNTADRRYKSAENPGGGVSVGDSEHFLPAFDDPKKARVAAAISPDALGLTSGVLRLSTTHPPVVSFDHHEDEMLAASYIYAQGEHGPEDPIAVEIVEVMRAAGVQLQMEGQTRFHETVRSGIVCYDKDGGLVSDGSVNELLTSKKVIIDGQVRPGPGARLGIVVETPAKDLPLHERMKAHTAVFRSLPRLWEMTQE